MIYGLVEARGICSIESSTKKGVAHALFAFSSVDPRNARPAYTPSGSVSVDLFRHRFAAPVAPAAAAAARASGVARTVVDTTGVAFSYALGAASWRDFCFAAAGADGHGPMPSLFLHYSISPERLLQICITFATTLIRPQRMHFHIFLGFIGLVDPPSCWMSSVHV